MFCPKCGQQNPETGKFCRSCGTDLGNVSDALMGKTPRDLRIVDKKGKPVSFEGAITKMFTGLAFVIIACVLGYTGMAGGKVWWFWMLIPGLRRHRTESGRGRSASRRPPQTKFASPESKFRTGDLVPPSVTDNTTRHLEMDSESKTMALPKE